MSLIIAGQKHEFPNSVSFADDPRWTGRVPEDGYKYRTLRKDIKRVIFHRTLGDEPDVVRPGAGPDGAGAENNAVYWSRNGRAGATHFLVDRDGQVLQLWDPSAVAAYGAGWANDGVAQIEIVEYPKVPGELWEAQLEAFASLCDLLAVVYPIDRVVQVGYHRKPLPGIRERWEEESGAFGHCDLTSNRGRWDPGDAARAVLVAHGWLARDLSTKATPPVQLPSWLKASAEVDVTGSDLDRGPFIELCVDTLLDLDVPLGRAFEATGNSLQETAWGTVYGGNNCGGVKIHKYDVEDWDAKHPGVPCPWWKRPGHRGEKVWEFYVAYDSPRDFWKHWLANRCPKPGQATHNFPQYAETGVLFWSDGDWRRAMCLTGYKGPDTAADPTHTLQELASLARSARMYWAQMKLGVTADGQFGPLSKAALKERTGSVELSDENLSKLVAPARPA